MTIQIPNHLHAKEPVEYTKGSRDQVKLMVTNPRNNQIVHTKFSNLKNYLQKGDLLVFNNSRTIPSVLDGSVGKKSVEVRLAHRLNDAQWKVLLLDKTIDIGDTIIFSKTLLAVVAEKSTDIPLVTLTFSQSGVSLMEAFYRIGKPIHYEYIEKDIPLDAYQTVYGTVPGSVELASAGRPFTWTMMDGLKSSGMDIAFIQLHTGLSYYENDRWPDPIQQPEHYHVPERTAELVNKTKQSGGRVIAVGTTVVRALESAAKKNRVNPIRSSTNLYINQSFSLQIVDGLLTGLHEPEASHLDMLSAFIDPVLLKSTYEDAIKKEYKWHEFGDMNLILAGAL
ncbi:S-adenosylmethionine:tRNA ribosyltransferase-isomerase [Radiobacillus kanasensis]|uniref:S-adenosylmethionine:tRNA ribosyltransferase-isomerase n=1 Tax=Radiobacillus kanasensis TaxID=2844358 RepID=UPI001E364849|nr:S-adenosylmethionine:tRNA ribosyltransferase-isomerase [Radiobacillus kanasensis]UFT99160.1 S-adenosylmethionine:tRNA ribosyltransferase-isomerase [Radiobacillus kanasensis]